MQINHILLRVVLVDMIDTLVAMILRVRFQMENALVGKVLLVLAKTGPTSRYLYRQEVHAIGFDSC